MVGVLPQGRVLPIRRLAIGPRLPGFGSWQWLGEDLARGLADHWEVAVFDEEPADADVVLWIKFLPSLDVLRQIAQRSAMIYCPVDAYGSAAEIDRDAVRLMLCRRIVVHAPRLVPYFQSYAPTTCLEHHIKFVIPTRQNVCESGPILWVGVRSNLGPLVEYANRHRLPADLVVLTNPETEADLVDPERLGFSSRNSVQIERWSPEIHRDWLTRCRAAIDIKGDDFRSRHKPAAKALDFLASGIPLAMNADSSSVAAIRELGFEIVRPEAEDVWLSPDYAQATRRFGLQITETLALSQLIASWREILEEASVAVPRRNAVSLSLPNGIPHSLSASGPRIAIVSLLFNWPSTGGGTVHTAETARFLSRAGYNVRHVVIQYDRWKLGQIADAVDWPIEVLRFCDEEWRRSTILQQVREAVRKYRPDHVILTDSWSFKPRFAEAVNEFPYSLRLAAQETLCPLNNVRLLWNEKENFQACPRHQLATPAACRQCVQTHAQFSGGLHRAERELAGFFEPDYVESLRKSYAEAASVLVVNPLIAECVKPYTHRVRVVPSGFDPARFQWPWPEAAEPTAEPSSRLKILFAGLVDEPMKGFSVLQAACAQLWQARQDFVVQATADPPGLMNEFTEFIGWQNQAQLPLVLRRADVVVCPTVAEEALGRTAVEAMGVGRPVVASRLGGLSFTVLDEATGLLCAPGNPTDLARQLARLLDDAALRERLGTAGRRRFETEYAWPVIIERHYQPLLAWRHSPAIPGEKR